MKNLNRDCYQNDTKGGLSTDCNNEIQQQINQAWEEYKQAKAERIKREIALAWKEYEELSKCEEYNEECDSESNEFEYKKNKKRAERRRARECAKNRTIKNAKVAGENLTKRAEKDRKNLIYHNFYIYEDKGLIYHINGKAKSCCAKADALAKRAKKLQH